MNIDSRIAKGIIVAGISLGSLLTNPNFEPRDIGRPECYIQKFDYQRGYAHSGKYYTASAGVLAASLVALAYVGMTKK